MTQAASHPAGWYPDPWAAGWWRWWDGTAWSGHTAPMGAPGAPGVPTEPLPGPPDAPAGGLLVRALQTVSSLGQSPEGAEVAARYRGSQPLPAQGRRPGRAWSGGTFALVLTVVITGFVLVGTVVAIVAGPEEGESSYVSPGFRPGAAIAAVVLAIVSVWAWRRYWLIADTPTVEVAGAHPGLCELTGTARPLGEPVTSWFTGAPVVWYHATVERRTRSSNNKQRWRMVWRHDGGSRRFLLVGDEGAAIEVDVQGAVLDGDRLIARHEPDRSHRFTENALVSGDRVYVLGPVRLCDDGHLRVMKRARRDAIGGRRGPLWITQGDESKLRRRLRRTAIAATVISMALAAFVTAVEEVPSDDLEHDTELAVRSEGALLVPALTVAGLMAAGYLVGYWWRLWNRRVALRWQAGHAWSLIDVAAARRHDTIGQLVAVTTAAVTHERAAQVDAAAGRSGLPEADEVSRVDTELAGDAPARRDVVARAEAAPDLGAGVVFTGLFQELVSTENRVAAARRFYNDAVTELADRTSTFPGLLLKPFVAPTIPPLLTFDPADLRPPATTP